jgi:hypothetical protein
VVAGGLALPLLVDALWLRMQAGPVVDESRASSWDISSIPSQLRFQLPALILLIGLVGFRRLWLAPPGTGPVRTTATVAGLIAADWIVGIGIAGWPSWHWTPPPVPVLGWVLGAVLVNSAMEESLRAYFVRHAPCGFSPACLGPVIATLLFTGFHSHQGGAILLYQALVSGVLYCFVAAYSRNTLALFIAHSATNMFATSW